MRNTHHARGRSARGLTLLEILIVVAIIALVSGGVAVAAVKVWQDTQVETTLTNARSLRRFATQWVIYHAATRCPSLKELFEDGTLDPDSPTADAWGTPWKLQCDEASVRVRSAGPDKQFDTEDDIRSP